MIVVLILKFMVNVSANVTMMMVGSEDTPPLIIYYLCNIAIWVPEGAFIFSKSLRRYVISKFEQNNEGIKQQILHISTLMCTNLTFIYGINSMWYGVDVHWNMYVLSFAGMMGSETLIGLTSYLSSKKNSLPNSQK